MRRRTFEKVKKICSEQEAIEETRPGLACDWGLGCGISEKVFIYSTIEKIGGKYRVDDEKCDGCGLCVYPKENIRMVEE